MNQVTVNNVSRSLPSSWNELTYRQLLQVCSMFSLGVQASHFKLGLLMKFLGLKKRLWKKVDPQDAYFLCESLNFLLEDVTLTKALVKSIRMSRFPWTRLYGPADSMIESTFGEFTKAQVRYELYDLKKDPAILDEMIAVLFRPKRSFWWLRRHLVESPDPRRRFIDRTLSKRARAISPVDPAIKQAIFMYFSGVQKSLPDQFPNVYKKKPGDDKSKSGGWSTLIISLADGKTDDQSLDRVLHSNLYNVFMGLEQKSIEYFEFLKNHPQND